MRSSSALRIALALGLAGCAHAPAPQTGAPPAAPPARTTSATTGGSASTAPAANTNPRLDPSEEITPEELAAIPEPVPGAVDTAPIVAPAQTPGQTQPAPGAPLSAPAPSPPAPGPAPTPGSAPGNGGRWRVQVFASPDLAAADSVAKAASALLQATYAIEYEGTLYKVRLGSFASEEEAQALRERAVRSGYPGAFRVRTLTR